MFERMTKIVNDLIMYGGIREIRWRSWGNSILEFREFCSRSSLMKVLMFEKFQN